jgi:hypothetical protein
MRNGDGAAGTVAAVVGAVVIIISAAHAAPANIRFLTVEPSENRA